MLLFSLAAHAADAPPGAEACSGCHAPAAKTAGALPPITGRDPADIITAMEAFRAGTRPATVMNRIVKGFSPDEVRGIATWLAAQK